MKNQSNAISLIAGAVRPDFDELSRIGIGLQTTHFAHRSLAFRAGLSKIACIFVFAFVGGCGSMATTQPTADQKQDDVLNDPMGYKPNMNHDISGGDITHFDGNGFKQDMNDALNP